MSGRLHLVTMGVQERGATPVAGLAGWLLEAVRVWRVGARKPQRKHMRVVETMVLGAKHKLLLVSCGGERFLVGTGPESVGTIVRVKPESVGSAALREQI